MPRRAVLPLLLVLLMLVPLVVAQDPPPTETPTPTETATSIPSQTAIVIETVTETATLTPSETASVTNTPIGTETAVPTSVGTNPAFEAVPLTTIPTLASYNTSIPMAQAQLLSGSSYVGTTYAIIAPEDVNTLYSLATTGGCSLSVPYDIYLTQGIYTVTSTIHFSCNTRIYGRGVQFTFLEHNPTVLADGIFEVNPGATLDLHNLTVRNGRALNDGGAGLIWGNARLNIYDSRFENNIVPNGGGAVYIAENGFLFIRRSEFRNNAAEIGGAIFSIRILPPLLQLDAACTLFQGNISTATENGWAGGAIASQNAYAVITSSNFSSNSANSGIAVLRHVQPILGTINAAGNYWFNPTVAASATDYGVNTTAQLMSPPNCPMNPPIPIPGFSTSTPTPTFTATATPSRTNTRTPTRTATLNPLTCITVSRTSITLTEGGTSVNYNVRLNQSPAAGETVTITLNITFSNQFTFSPLNRQLNSSNWNTGRNFDFTAVNDTIPEVTLTATLTHTATSNQGGSGFNGAQACTNATVTLIDDDGSTLTPTFTHTPSATATYTLTPTFTHTPSATATYTRTSTPTAPFCPLSSGASVENTPGGTPCGATPTPTTVPYCIVTTQTAFTLIEGSPSSVTYNVRLSQAPQGFETVTIVPLTVPNPSGQYTITPVERKLNASNWSTGRSFTFIVEDDSIPEMTRVFQMDHQATTNMPSYFNNTIGCQQLTVTLVDNDMTPTPSNTRTPTATLPATVTPTSSPSPVNFKYAIYDGANRAWSVTERSAIATAVMNVGNSFNFLAQSVNTPQEAFNLVMIEASGTEVLFVRADLDMSQSANRITISNYQYQYGNLANQNGTFSYPDASLSGDPRVGNGECLTYRERLLPNGVRRPAAIVCDGNLRDNRTGAYEFEASEYTLVHEMGHLFDDRTSQGLSIPISNSSVEDCIGDIVMGEFQGVWTRGRRGWGTGPAQYTSTQTGNPVILITYFQQNSSNTGSETAADLFLNWVYRINASGVAAVDSCTLSPTPPANQWNGPGFLNQAWSATPLPNFITNPAGVPGTLDNTLPGDVRHLDMDSRMLLIFQSRSW